MITSLDFAIISLMIFAVGLFGILFNKKNLLIMLMSIEIILLGANMNFVGFASLTGEPEGIMYSLLILTVAAAEAAIALAILVLYFRNRRSVNVDNLSDLKG
jgi:NADH-quinone oxidoreductase subunit K